MWHKVFPFPSLVAPFLPVRTTVFAIGVSFTEHIRQTGLREHIDCSEGLLADCDGRYIPGVLFSKEVLLVIP